MRERNPSPNLKLNANKVSWQAEPMTKVKEKHRDELSLIISHLDYTIWYQGNKNWGTRSESVL